MMKIALRSGSVAEAVSAEYSRRYNRLARRCVLLVTEFDRLDTSSTTFAIDNPNQLSRIAVALGGNKRRRQFPSDRTGTVGSPKNSQ